MFCLENEIYVWVLHCDCLHAEIKLSASAMQCQIYCDAHVRKKCAKEVCEGNMRKKCAKEMCERNVREKHAKEMCGRNVRKKFVKEMCFRSFLSHISFAHFFPLHFAGRGFYITLFE